MSLLALQHDFRDFLLDSPHGAKIAVGDNGAGLAVYHNAYRAQLVDCLKDSYERLWAWLGDDAFAAAAANHIGRHPPISWTMADYGGQFSHTLSELYPTDPEVAEIAALDWALRRAFDGPNGAALDPSSLAEVDWPAARLHFAPTLTWLEVTTNCGAIWNGIAAGEDVPAMQMLPTTAWIRVWRSGYQPQFRTVEEDERHALDLAQWGLPFAAICDRLAAKASATSAVETAGGFLSTWIEDGLLLAVR